MSKYYGLIIPRSYNDYFSRSDPQAIKEIINLGTDAQLDEESTAPIQNQAVAKLVPAAASEENKLADKDFVNSTVGTNTAIFRGTFDSVEDLEAYAGEKTNNDYAFVIGTDSAGNTEYNRYKYDGTEWVYEYTLNNSSFTAEQWAAIQSGITEELVAKIGDTGIVPVTSADYEDLPEDEKNADKLYLLTDANNGFITVTDTVEAGNDAVPTSDAVNNALANYQPKLKRIQWDNSYGTPHYYKIPNIIQPNSNCLLFIQGRGGEFVIVGIGHGENEQLSPPRATKLLEYSSKINALAWLNNDLYLKINQYSHEVIITEVNGDFDLSVTEVSESAWGNATLINWE